MLAIRLHALGDVVITLPYLKALSEDHPETAIDFVTLAENADIPRAVALFDRVFAIGGGRSPRGHLVAATALAPRLMARRYDVVVDLQRNRASRWMRRMIAPKAWSEFDRYSARSAGERTQETITFAGLGGPTTTAPLPMHDPAAGLQLLYQAGWNGRDPLVVLNPAGCWNTKNWPLAAYIDFARLWRQSTPWSATRFLLLGTASLAASAAEIRAELGATVLDLVGRTSPAEAYAILRRAALIVTDDSGLMHMAWVSGVPTVALFGASRAYWSAPQGAHTRTLDSSDMPCGQCMQPVCALGDVRCLKRHTPARVYELARELTDSVAMASAL